MDRKGRMNMCFDDVSKDFAEKSVDVISTSLPAGLSTFDEMNQDNSENVCLANNTPSSEMPPESKTEDRIQIPTTLQKFMNVTSKYSKEELHSFINQIIITHRSELDNLGVFFNVIVEYACYIADNGKSDITILDILIPYLYELAEMSTKVAAQYLLLILKETEQHFEDDCKIKKHKKLHYPKLSTLIILKVCCILFPTSDFRHLVTSPALLFITRLLVECHVLNVRDVLCGLFTCSLSLECVSYSKQFLPEALNFLTGLLTSAVCKHSVNLYSPFADFKTDLTITF